MNNLNYSNELAQFLKTKIGSLALTKGCISLFNKNFEPKIKHAIRVQPNSLVVILGFNEIFMTNTNACQVHLLSYIGTGYTGMIYTLEQLNFYWFEFIDNKLND